MSTLSPDGTDFVRRLLVDHHMGCRFDAGDDKETRLWHLFVTLCAWARSEGIDVREVFTDAMHHDISDGGHTAFSWAEVGSLRTPSPKAA